MTTPLVEFPFGHGVRVLSVTPVVVALASPLLRPHGQSLAQFFGRLVERFHTLKINLAAQEVKS